MQVKDDVETQTDRLLTWLSAYQLTVTHGRLPTPHNPTAFCIRSSAAGVIRLDRSLRPVPNRPLFVGHTVLPVAVELPILPFQYHAVNYSYRSEGSGLKAGTSIGWPAQFHPSSVLFNPVHYFLAQFQAYANHSSLMFCSGSHWFPRNMAASKAEMESQPY